MGPWQNDRLAGRIPTLDGIRGLAILLVLIWHYVVPNDVVQLWAPGSWKEHAMASLRLTWTGVDLFFVMSGFLIGGILYDAKNSEKFYKTFYLRRISRIFPIYFLWIGLFIVGLWCVGPNSGTAIRAIFNQDVPTWSYALFLQNVAMSSRQLWGAQWLAITWSLAVEEQFYLILPFVVRNLDLRGIAWTAVAAIVLAPIIRVVLWHSGNVYFGPYTLLPCRADALAFGVLVALACRNQRSWTQLSSHRGSIFATFVILGGGMVFLTKYDRYANIIGASWIAAFYTSLLLLAIVNPGRIVNRLFCNRMLTQLGIVSYAVYIFHQGINDLIHFAIFGMYPSFRTWPTQLVTLLSLGAVFLLAAASWRFIEAPILKRARATFRYFPAREAENSFGTLGEPALVSVSASEL